jgi:membrane-bound serine protease (ClpP class)
MAVFLTALAQIVAVSNWLPVVLWALWVAKDLLLLPQIGSLERSRPSTGQEGLIGTKAVTREPLDPAGYVTLRGELWKAVADSEEQPIPAGSRVEVRGVRGLTLVVQREAVPPPFQPA